jgi:glutathione synthase/RimK-type ligase-like ATP-grasp enzyme
MMRKIGLIVGREWSFPPAFLEAVQRRNAGVVAEYVRLGGTRMNEPCQYAVLIDRISHEVPYYRSYLKNAVLQGVHVVNDPFMWTADDKFFEASLAARLGVAHPKTVVLPNREYVPGIVHTESLRNLVYPLDWGAIVDHVGLPCILKDAHGGGWKNVSVCHSLDELLFHYNQSGLLTMIAQEFIQWESYVRCLVLGQEEVLVMRYDPGPRKYLADAGPLEPSLEKRIVGDCLKLCRALGYDMNTLEWAVRGGVPYAIDFMNPAPDMDINSLTPAYFQWAVEHMADLAIRLALNPRPQRTEYRWGKGP